MENFIIVIILLVIVAGGIWYLARQKKCGAACIGCPYSKQCAGKCSGEKK